MALESKLIGPKVAIGNGPGILIIYEEKEECLEKRQTSELLSNMGG